jgi:hypothetical protein
VLVGSVTDLVSATAFYDGFGADSTGLRRIWGGERPASASRLAESICRSVTDWVSSHPSGRGARTDFDKERVTMNMLRLRAAGSSAPCGGQSEDLQARPCHPDGAAGGEKCDGFGVAVPAVVDPRGSENLLRFGAVHSRRRRLPRLSTRRRRPVLGRPSPTQPAVCCAFRTGRPGVTPGPAGTVQDRRRAFRKVRDRVF